MGCENKFQFQTGSIKRKALSDEDRIKTVKFQFQTGSIKRDFQNDAVWGFTKFQFQTGSIKSANFSLASWVTSVSIPNWFD